MTEPRPTTSRAPLPAFRAAVFALVGTVLGVCAHRLVAEGPPPWRQGAAAAAVLFAVGLAGARRPRSRAAVVAACGAGQAALHLWLSTAHAHPSSPARAHHGPGAQAAWYDSSAMTAVHAASAVVVALLLHGADAVCWSPARGPTAAVDAARARTAVVGTLLGTRAAVPAVPALVRAWPGRPCLKGSVLTDVVVRRGPPRSGTAPAL
ncbi:hypothetical protein [Streptomyces sp. CC219B]|uniref:hypothetical protein n=1 Tax=Streptomyces sp. CC219B TaxID=3044574 RepID=UPI0024A94BC3|nr:hypothetical protein [Streptomyces sp. CC219B]